MHSHHTWDSPEHRHLSHVTLLMRCSPFSSILIPSTMGQAFLLALFHGVSLRERARLTVCPQVAGGRKGWIPRVTHVRVLCTCLEAFEASQVLADLAFQQR